MKPPPQGGLDVGAKLAVLTDAVREADERIVRLIYLVEQLVGSKAELVSRAAPKAHVPPGPWHQTPAESFTVEIAVFPMDERPWVLRGGNRRVERFRTFREAQAALPLFADRVRFDHAAGEA